MRLISSPFNVASAQEVPFRHPQQLQYMYHGLTIAYLCVLFFFSITTEVSICGSAREWLLY